MADDLDAVYRGATLTQPLEKRGLPESSTEKQKLEQGCWAAWLRNVQRFEETTDGKKTQGTPPAKLQDVRRLPKETWPLPSEAAKKSRSTKGRAPTIGRGTPADTEWVQLSEKKQAEAPTKLQEAEVKEDAIQSKQVEAPIRVPPPTKLQEADVRRLLRLAGHFSEVKESAIEGKKSEDKQADQLLTHRRGVYVFNEGSLTACSQPLDAAAAVFVPGGTRTPTPQTVVDEGLENHWSGERSKHKKFRTTPCRRWQCAMVEAWKMNRGVGGWRAAEQLANQPRSEGGTMICTRAGCTFAHYAQELEDAGAWLLECKWGATCPYGILCTFWHPREFFRGCTPDEGASDDEWSDWEAELLKLTQSRS